MPYAVVRHGVAPVSTHDWALDQQRLAGVRLEHPWWAGLGVDSWGHQV